MSNWRYIVFEGIDGAGKSTQITRVYQWLRELNYTPIQLSEPTNGTYGRRARNLMAGGMNFGREAQIELFSLDRQEHVKYKIEPLLRLIESTQPHCSFVLIQDRSYFSIPAYQGADDETIAQLTQSQEAFAPRPDMVLLIDVPVDLALLRITGRGRNVVSLETPEILSRARANYSLLAKLHSNVVRIDGVGTPDEVFGRICAELRFERFDPPSGPRGEKAALSL